MALPTPTVLANAGSLLEVGQPVLNRGWELRLNADSGPATHGPFPANQLSVLLPDLTVGNFYHVYTRLTGTATWSPRLRVQALPLPAGLSTEVSSAAKPTTPRLFDFSYVKDGTRTQVTGASELAFAGDFNFTPRS